MRLQKTSRSWSQELELRRLIADAAAQYSVAQYPVSQNAGSQNASLEHSQLGSAEKLSNPTTPRLKARILPLDEQGKTGIACQIQVKEFDERGITFQHQRPLHDRRALVVLEGPNHERIAAEVDLSWCRFSQRGQYTSGGRFVSLVGLSA